MPIPVPRFAALADCTDPVVVVETSDLLAADRVALAVLRNKGIDPDAVTGAEGLALLRDLAVAEATAHAAKRGASDGESALWKKYEVYARTARELAVRLDRESLGLAVTGSGSAGYGTLALRRG